MHELPEIPSGFTDLLDAPIAVTLATISPDGSPHLSLIWRIWDPPYMLMGTDPNSRKARNIFNNPQVAIMTVDPDNDHRYITAYGIASIEHTPDGSIYDRIGLLYRNKSTYNGREVPEEDKKILYTIRARIFRFTTFTATKEIS